MSFARPRHPLRCTSKKACCAVTCCDVPCIAVPCCAPRRGFSIGIDDVTPKGKLVVEKAATVDKGYAECQEFLVQYKKVGSSTKKGWEKGRGGDREVGKGHVGQGVRRVPGVSRAVQKGG